MLTPLRPLIKRLLWRLGYDLIRRQESPRATLLGLRTRHIRTIIDVGANSGQFAREIAPLFPAAQLHCFEPLPAPFAELDRWIAISGRNGRAYNFALGDRSADV